MSFRGKRENFRNFLELLLKATGGADIKKGPYPGPFPCSFHRYEDGPSVSST